MPMPAIPSDRPVLGQDLNLLAARLNRTSAECCALLGISQSTWSVWKKRGDQPIPSPTVALAIRLYDCFPELAPREPTPEDLTMSDSTQPVMTSGTQISRPVMK